MLGCRAATRGHTRCIRESDGIQRAAVGWHGCMVSLWPDEWPSDCAESDAAVLQLVPLCAHNEEPKTLCDTPRFEQSNRRIGVAYGNQPTDLTRRLQDTCDCLSLSYIRLSHHQASVTALPSSSVDAIPVASGPEEEVVTRRPRLCPWPGVVSCYRKSVKPALLFGNFLLHL